MKGKWNATKVGVLVMVALIATWAVYRFVDERGDASKGYRVWTLFDDAQGLVPKSRVVVAGIPVGSIERIRLWGSRARVDIRINKDVPLYRDARVSKQNASILGESMLVLYPGTVGQPRLQDGERIHNAQQSAGTGEILENVNETVKSVRQVAAQFERAFGNDEAGDRMSKALRDLSEALEGVNHMIAENRASVTNTIHTIENTTADASPKISRILENVERATTDIKEIIGQRREGEKAPDEKTGGTVGDTVASVNRASEKLEEVLKDVKQVTGRTARGEGTIGRLTHDEALIDEVQGVAEGVGEIVGGIARLQTIVGLRSEYNFLANTFKSYVELRLQPREDRYYLIQLVDDPRGVTDNIQTTVRTSPPPADTPPFYQETRTVTRNSFRFSLMFAKRIHFATFRFGILESTGGIGTDLHFLNDDLELNIDFFAFGEQVFPRLRARLAYEVVKRFWILGGVDDALNKNVDFFLGGQLRFNDEDLKSILPFAGGAMRTGG